MRDRIALEQNFGENDSARCDATSEGESLTYEGRIRLQGRGGAGNYPQAPSQSTKPTSEDTTKLENEKPDLRRTSDVELGLKRPDRVHLGPD